MFKKITPIILLFLMATPSLFANQEAKEFVVYGTYRAVNMGNPGEIQQRDLYVDMGTRHGLKTGSILDVYRRSPTYDLMSKNLRGEVVFSNCKN